MLGNESNFLLRESFLADSLSPFLMIMPPSSPSLSDAKNRKLYLATLGLLALVLGLLFARSFGSGWVLFSNDGPLGGMVAAQNRMPGTLTGFWSDTNSIGVSGGMQPPSISNLLLLLLGPVGFAKFIAPCTLFLLGLCAAFAFRRSNFAPLACVLSGLAAALNMDFLGAAAWGVCAQVVCFSMNFVAVGLLISKEPRGKWVRTALAGLAIGMGVMEGADIGALFSMLVAAFVLYNAWAGTEGTPGKRFRIGIGQVVVVAACAMFIAISTVTTLISTNIKGVAGTQQDSQTKAQRWDFATQWSLPKREALNLIIPGLFGYRMDTPLQLPEFMQETYKGGNYWGAVGRDPAWDRYFASGRQGAQPSGFMRFSGGGNYAGILVVLIALWAGAQSLRRHGSIFSETARRHIWFWLGVVVISLLFAFGRFAPFYQFLYALPYFSTIRNPGKFTHLLTFALLMLFAYGVDGLWRGYLQTTGRSTSNLKARLKGWGSGLSGFDQRWVLGCAAGLGASLLGWLFYAASRQSFEQYLQTVQFDESMAHAIAGFSITQVGWFILFFALSASLLTLVLKGTFAGRRAKWGGVLLGLLLVVDLSHANLPLLIYWDYKDKYETDAPNPVIEILRQKPYEHRVAMLPFRAPPQFSLFDQLYRIEWAQHHFYYYNIQSLDIVQMPRMPQDLMAYESVLFFDGTTNRLHLITRRWQLTNTRYLLGAAGFLDVLNQQIDPVQHRFRIAAAFDIVPKAGSRNATQLTDLTAALKPDGQYALFEFTGALPRVKLFANWLVSTNDDTTLKKLASPSFDPAETVLVAEPLPPASGTSKTAGTVDFTSYSPKKIVLHAQAAVSSVLLLNDKFDPNWQVTVDGKPVKLLRCNYIMRGVYLEPGSHTIEFAFRPSLRALRITLAAIALGLLLISVLAFRLGKGKPVPAP